MDAARDAMIEACAQTFLERMRRARAASEERAEDLRHRAREAARLLVELHGAARVWLFGSLAWGQAHASSDVDLLVEGLESRAWLQVTKTVEDVLEAAVDVVRAEEAPAELLRRVREEGVLLHERR